MLGDLDPLEAEGAHRLDQDHDAGDDRRRAVGVQAGDLARSASGAEASCESRRWIVGRERTWPVDARGVVGLEAQLDRGQRGGGAGDGDAGRRPGPRR